jgi:hypothetical protein
MYSARAVGKISSATANAKQAASNPDRSVRASLLMVMPPLTAISTQAGAWRDRPRRSARHSRHGGFMYHRGARPVSMPAPPVAVITVSHLAGTPSRPEHPKRPNARRAAATAWGLMQRAATARKGSPGRCGNLREIVYTCLQIPASGRPRPGAQLRHRRRDHRDDWKAARRWRMAPPIPAPDRCRDNPAGQAPRRRARLPPWISSTSSCRSSW